MSTKHTLVPDAFKQLPADFFELEADNISQAECALREGHKELTGHVLQIKFGIGGS